jgi:hypothetical protein
MWSDELPFIVAGQGFPSTMKFFHRRRRNARGRRRATFEATAKCYHHLKQRFIMEPTSLDTDPSDTEVYTSLNTDPSDTEGYRVSHR